MTRIITFPPVALRTCRLTRPRCHLDQLAPEAALANRFGAIPEYRALGHENLHCTFARRVRNVAAQSHPLVIGDGPTSATDCENVQRCKILDCVHSLAKRHVGRQVHNSCPASLRVIKVPPEVFDARAETFCTLVSLWQVHFGVR